MQLFVLQKLCAKLVKYLTLLKKDCLFSLYKGKCFAKQVHYYVGINLKFAAEFEYMDEELDWQRDDEIGALVSRFEALLKSGEGHFFDVEEFEAIIDYYLDIQQTSLTRSAIEWAKEQHPGSNSFKIREARLLTQEAKYNQALKILDSLDMLEKGNEELYYAKAEIYSLMDKHEEAIDAYKKVLETAERPEEILSNIAYEYESLNDYPNALRHLTKALELRPDSEDLIQEIAFFFELTGREEEAIEFFGNFLDRHPYSKFAWFNLGIFYSNVELYEKAIQAYEFAVAIDDDFASAYFNMANAYTNIQQYRKAISLYEETLKLEKPDAITYCYIGESWENLNNLEKALIHYNRALDLDDKLADAWGGVARIFVRQNMEKTAIKYYEKAIQLAPLQDDLKFELAVLLLRNNQLDKSAKLFDEVINHNGHYVEAWLNYSLVLALQEKFADAINLLGKALKENPSEAKILYRRAGYLYRISKIEEAYFDIEEAVKLNFDEHEELLRYLPELLDEPRFVEILDLYKKPNS